MLNTVSRLWLVSALLAGAGYSQDVVRVAATESPLSALQHVRAARCEGRSRGAVALAFAPGRRFLAEPIVLTPSDSGIAFVAERPGTVVFDYGRVLPKFTAGKDGVWRTLHDYRVKLLKKMGANANRTCHNPPSPEFLDACDRQGVLVMDETRMFEASCISVGQNPIERRRLRRTQSFDRIGAATTGRFGIFVL